MPMERDKFEEILNKLNNHELDHSERVDLLGVLRNDYNNVHNEFESLSTEKEKLAKDNHDLVVANGKLFRDQGIAGGEGEEDEPAEPVRLSELIKNADQYY